ncbi:transposase [Arthrobacter sp. StoSoilB20]|uniref:transposase n=1 Tax=Arthrobacter sp. StoSoilB20 TaxID=2830995 RepID=UPI001CC69D80|nr:transposase [Arthrobacter sp. StoSoilB20]
MQHRSPYARPGERLLSQLDLVGSATRIRALEGNLRPQHKWEHLDEPHKPSVKANTAIARELAGWCWSLAAPLQQGDRMTVA